MKIRLTKVQYLETLLFATVRNLAILPIGQKLGKTQKEITEKTFETIEEIKKKVDIPQMRSLMRLADTSDNPEEKKEKKEDA